MKKRVLPIILSCILVLCMMSGLAPSSLAAGSLSNFGKSRIYSDGMFTDVDPGAWYAGYVKSAYEYALVDGVDEDGFKPQGRLTIAEAVKLAVCLYRGYNNIQTGLAGGNTWYEPYVAYAKQNGIIKEDYPNYNAAATRADFAVIIGGALPDEAVTVMNRIEDGALPDVLLSYSYGPAVYRLYRAGVLTGSDKNGTFYPGRSIQRAEAAAICVRMLDAQSRVPLVLAGELRAEELYSRSVSAVFYIEIFDKDDELVKTGSGFFISETGDAVTNYHVVVGGHSAKVTTPGGEVYNVLGIYDFDWKKDIAIIKVEGEDFPYLTLGNSDTVAAGETVYAIGSPLGLQNSLSRGIISSALRVINETQYIQFDAALSSGSSGGPVLSSSGLVIGIASAGADGGQNLNLAVPINLIHALDRTEYAALDTQLKSVPHYRKFPGVPDLGAYMGVETLRVQLDDEYAEYSYKVADFDKDIEEVIDDYKLLLEQNLFTLFGYYESGGRTFDAYYNASTGLLVMFGTEKVKGAECITVIVRPMF